MLQNLEKKGVPQETKNKYLNIYTPVENTLNIRYLYSQIKIQ
jgi:hypothetical protein